MEKHYVIFDVWFTKTNISLRLVRLPDVPISTRPALLKIFEP